MSKFDEIERMIELEEHMELRHAAKVQGAITLLVTLKSLIAKGFTADEAINHELDRYEKYCAKQPADQERIQTMLELLMVSTPPIEDLLPMLDPPDEIQARRKERGV